MILDMLKKLFRRASNTIDKEKEDAERRLHSLEVRLGVEQRGRHDSGNMDNPINSGNAS